jgi:hypothetical protein
MSDVQAAINANLKYFVLASKTASTGNNYSLCRNLKDVIIILSYKI